MSISKRERLNSSVKNCEIIYPCISFQLILISNLSPYWNFILHGAILIRFILFPLLFFPLFAHSHSPLLICPSASKQLCFLFIRKPSLFLASGYWLQCLSSISCTL